MPNPEQILAGLTEIANSWRWLAIAWHAYFAILAMGLITQRRPSKQLFGILLGLPLLSVSVLAWLVGNSFNGTLFAVTGLSLIVIAARLPQSRVRLIPWEVVLGTFMFAFGWGYPHFLTGLSYHAYLYSAPTGLLPCPTLSIIIGLAVATNGIDSRVWSLILGLMGVFYGTFGAAILGVGLDWVLMVGAIFLVAIACGLPRRRLGELADANKS